MRNGNRLGLRGLWLAIAALLVGGCGPCGGDDGADPMIEEPTPGENDEEGSGTTGNFQTYDSEGDSRAAHPELPPPREDLPPPHLERPGAESFAVTPVTGDWTMFRGNATRSGLREAPAIEAPFIEWRARIGIQGYANTPLLVGDRIYVSSQGNTHDEPDELDGVTALNMADGSVIWRQDTDHDANGIALAEGVLLVGTDSGKLYAFNPENGAELWVAEVGCRVYHAPYVHDGYAYLPRLGGYARLSLEDGSIEGDPPECRYTERGASSGDDGYVAFAFSRSPMQVVQDNQFLWAGIAPEVDFRMFGSWAPPLLTRDMVIQAAHLWPFYDEGDDADPNRRPSATARWRDNGQLVWATDLNQVQGDPTEETDRATRHLRSLPWIAGERMFWTPTTRDEIVAVDVTTGRQVGTIELPDCRRRQFPSIVGTPEMGYLARHDGVVYAFRTDTLEIAWTLNLASEEVAGNQETHDAWEGIGCTANPRNGTGLFSTPAINEEGVLFVGSGEGWLYRVRNQTSR